MIGWLLDRFGLGPKLDITLGIPEGQQLRTALAGGEFQTAETMISKTGSWEQRDYLVEMAREWKGRPGWLDAWVGARPKSPIAFLVRGAHGVRWAWEARGTGLSAGVSNKAAEQFFARLKGAQRDLEMAAHLDARDPTPWAYRIPIEMNMSGEIEEVRTYFEEATQRDPTHRRAHWDMLNALQKRWLGSNAEMFSFAREAASNAPPGSSLPALIVEAHVHRCVEYAVTPEGVDPDEYLRRAAVQNEVLTAAQRTVLRPNAKPGYFNIQDMNLIAFAFWAGGSAGQARPIFEMLDGRATEHPWGFRGSNAAAVFRKAERQCGR